MLPNLYGDIITDEAAEFQGGVGTAGSGNIGKRYAMFEAIHGSAPRMVEGGTRTATPTRAACCAPAVMLLSHIGLPGPRPTSSTARAGQMHVRRSTRRSPCTGRDTGCTCTEFGDYVMRTIETL